TGRTPIRPDHAGVVLGAVGIGTGGAAEESFGTGGDESVICAVAAGQPAGPVARHPGRRIPGNDRRRGALCRYGAFRQEAGTRGMVYPGVAGIGDELLRPGGVDSA